MAVAGLTPPEWSVQLIDETLGIPDYDEFERPDLVGMTAFTSQANRAYELAAYFRSRGIPVVMGGIHATMCVDEASSRVDSVVTREAEGVWEQVLTDVLAGRLQRRYDGGLAEIDEIRPARHDLLPPDYAFGAIQTTRGCQLNCNFCSVPIFNGSKYRQRPAADIVKEFRSIPENRVLIVDDNFVGTGAAQIRRAKELFRALADANTGKRWIGQVTVNFGDDEELMTLAKRSGCIGCFVGFESPTSEGLAEINKKFNVLKDRDLRASVRRIQAHGIMVVGSFMIGLDVDTPGIGDRIAAAADWYGVDNMNVLFYTPLPGTRLWDQMKGQHRIAMDSFPSDWQYYTLTYPVARHQTMSLSEIIAEMITCNGTYYSLRNIFWRMITGLIQGRSPFYGVIANFSSRRNSIAFARRYAKFEELEGWRFSRSGGTSGPRDNRGLLSDLAR
ncbi:MAG: hypothetical protein A2133_07905 [Actinobacteria bacterium RBG_16_64_13]|nr:MAG: hypothetical protein A2133_07905 [Actinobacteria bacterium RBG_16_64_13]